MSEKRREERAEWLRSLSDEHFLFLYATRMARLRDFRKLNAPAQIIEKEIQLVDEAITECRNRSFFETRLKIAMDDERLLRRMSRRAS